MWTNHAIWPKALPWNEFLCNVGESCGMRYPKNAKGQVIVFALIGLVAVQCSSLKHRERAAEPQNVVVTGELKCCVGAPINNTLGWFLELDMPLSVAGKEMKIVEVMPAFQFQLESMEELEGKQVEIMGLIIQVYGPEMGKWIYILKLISVQTLEG